VAERTVGSWRRRARAAGAGTARGAAPTLALVALALVAAGGGAFAARRAAQGPANAAWPTFGQNLANWRLSAASQITPRNASSVVRLFGYALPKHGGGAETYPLEVGGTLVFTSSGGYVYALNATTFATEWTYAPTPAVGGIPNRGVAVASGRVFVLTPDDRLIALSLKTGTALFQTSVAGAASGAYESTAPVVAGGVVVVGSAGGDKGVRGFVAAYAASSGRLLWRTYMVPPPGRGWMAGPGVHGGGTVWMPPAVDLRTGTVYVATGNPAPDFFGPARPGSDPHTDSIVALSLKTGRILWAYSETRHDLWDYDAASPPVLFTADVGGAAVPAVMEAGKDGDLYVLAAKTGRPLEAPVPFVKIDHPAPTAQGTLVYPGTSGGDNYGPVAYDPALGLAYVFAVDGASMVYSTGKGTEGSRAVQGSAPWTGSVTAIQVATGKVAWTLSTATPLTGGGTVTRSGVLWFGSEGGNLYAVDAKSGKVLLKLDAGASIGAAPSAYELDGREYVAVAVGGSGTMETEAFSRPGPALEVFGLPPNA
jgi:alcohol dehydrogenase (cytochrome c)